MQKKTIALLLLAAMIVGLVSGCVSSSSIEDRNEPKELVIGMELAYPPFEMTDEEGNPTGISVDLAEALGEYLGRPIRIENIAFSGLIPALTTGKIDMIISSMTITEERKKTVRFSDPYSKAFLALLVNKASDISDKDELDRIGRKIAVKKGTTGHYYATENFEHAEVLVFDKESACVLEVVQGKADAFIYDQMTIFKNSMMYPEETIGLYDVLNADPEYWGIALRRDEVDEDLIVEVDAFLNNFRVKSGFDHLGDKYLSDIKEHFKENGIPFFF